jgi:hypothetical protein
MSNYERLDRTGLSTLLSRLAAVIRQGHIIKKGSTTYTSRESLKFGGGMNVTDDSTNNATIVDDTYEEIPWSTWNGYTAEQKAEHPNAIITNVPDVSINDKANKTDLTSIVATGSTNATGSTIASGKYFYLDGKLVRAKVDIANGASFTLNTNYEVVTAGALNKVQDDLNALDHVSSVGTSVAIASGTPYTCPSDGYLNIYIYNNKEMAVYINSARFFDVTNKAGTGQIYGLFVRKGMVISCTYTAGTDGSLSFFPFT